jgi:hypothetical protein
MPVMIEELNTTFDVQDDSKIRQIVRQEIRAALSERGTPSRRATDPADPGAGSASGEGRFG